MSAPLSDEQLAPIRTALQQKNKILAIKHYRELTHVSLAEAKHAVEQLEMGVIPTMPNSAPAMPSPAPLAGSESKAPAGLGCVIFILVLALGYFVFNGLDAWRNGQEELMHRHERASGMILCVWLTASATLNTANPNKRALGVVLWTVVFLVLSRMVYLEVWR